MTKKKILYLNPKKGAVAVKLGFSWPAFFFGSMWAMANRMWFPYLLFLLPLDAILWFVTGYAEGQNNPSLALIGLLATLVYAYFRGRLGNGWLAKSLISRGYAPTQASESAA